MTLPFLLALSLGLGGCGDDSGPADASSIDAAPVLGSFSLSWSLSDGAAAITCGEVGAVSVSVTLIPQGGFSGEVEPFSCPSGTGTSGGLRPGIYDVTIDVRASGSRSLLAEPVRIAGFEIVANAVTPMPAQSFVISTQGSFSFFLDGDAAGGNCESVANGGAGIVGVFFGLKDAANACVEADFVVAAGSEAGNTYSTNCTTPPAPLPCFGKDQLITVSNIPSGSWSMTSSAQKAGPIDCYERVSNFTVAGADLLTELGSLPLDLEYSEACDPDFTLPDGGLPDAGAPDGMAP